MGAWLEKIQKNCQETILIKLWNLNLTVFPNVLLELLTRWSDTGSIPATGDHASYPPIYDFLYEWPDYTANTKKHSGHLIS